MSTIGDTMYDKIFQLKNDDVLLNNEFNNLSNFYILKNKSEVFDFIFHYPELIIVLENMTNSLKNNFPDGEFELYIDRDFETSEESLIVDIKVDEYTFDNGIMEGIHTVNKEFRKLKRNLGVISKIFLMPALNQ